MIDYLRIRNLALITDAELDFATGMNVLTGETGAGKSFILKAINFIMGERLGADMVRPGQDRAMVEALFSLPEGDIVIRRELLAETGRSRFYINDTLSSQDTVRELRQKLILHAGQHGQQRLLQPAFQAELVDQWMKRPDLLEHKAVLTQTLRDALARKKALLTRSRELSERRELLELHLKDIEKVDPQPGEDDELEQQRVALRDSEHIRRHYERGLSVLRGGEQLGVLDALAALERELEALIKYDDSLRADLEGLQDQRAALTDLAHRLRRPPQTAVAGGDSDTIEARLYELAQLKRKLHRTLPQILAMREEIEENLSFLDACELDLRQADKDIVEAQDTLKVTLQECNEARRVAAASFCAALVNELKGLGFSEHVRIIPQFEAHELVAGCMEDRVRLLWAPNPGQHPQPLDRIASGGELSRFLLAVVSLQAEAEAATLIFDEVDAGIGGVTLNRVAERLCALAEQRQMLLITHWPQLAARAMRHFRVSKEIVGKETFTHCLQLDAEARQAELERMAGIEA